jgi:hypothetical protein
MRARTRAIAIDNSLVFSALTRAVEINTLLYVGRRIPRSRGLFRDELVLACVIPVIPLDYGRLRRWYYTRFPPSDVCPVTHWKHWWSDAWGDVTCRNCGKHTYIDYGR